ncbi:hypothetical protein GCM10009069_05430 [Algimonas arctica]|uniref:O-antigen ligase-related domain-containing protein n=1 Tax=Algimonas arctica TaxID=1479486 RepID=A0A8J3CQB5_9PROT|nr:O-antigen ligase family protein [Algimonas arctica]GHA85220.1 hypothetical protein GCM10009069_05430 [Algimonas arctica]
MNPSLYQTLAWLALLPIILLAYLFGGSSTEGLELRLITNGASAFLLVLLLMTAPRSQIEAFSRPLAAFFLMLFIILGLQVLPLPPSLWAALPFRETVVAELSYFERDLPWLPLSMTPGKTLIMMSELMPALLAAFVAVGLDQKRFIWLLGALLIISLISALWGFLQVLIPSNFGDYLWRVRSGGTPSGAYANINHQATHMLLSMPILALWVISLKRSSGLPDAFLHILGLSAFFIFFICLIAAGSVAGYILGAVAVLGTIWIYARKVREPPRRFRSQAVMPLLGGGCLAAIIVIIFTSPKLSGLGVTSIENTPLSRLGINELSLTILADQWFWGTGAGSFSQVYASYEAPELASFKYVNHAHNEFFEIFIEYGILPIGLLTLIGLYAVWRGFRKSCMTSTSQYAMMLVVLLAALNSFIDYPLRSQFLLITVIICAARLCPTVETRFASADRTG